MTSISEAGRCQPKPPPNAALEAIREKHHLPGLAAGRINLKGRDDHVTARAAGLRKIDNDAPLSTKDQFYLASVTKAMTSTLVAILMDEDETLTWTTTIAEALPHIENILPAYQNTTLAMLGAHVAGMDDEALVAADLELWMRLVNREVTPIEGRRLVAEAIFSSIEPRTPPGETYLYSNAGYMVLGHLIDSRVPGGWEEFIQDRLFTPLGMIGCGLGPVPQPALPKIKNPWPHTRGDLEPVPAEWDAEYTPAMGPASTAHCTIDSYAKYLSFHMDGLRGKDTSLLPAQAFEALHTPYTAFMGLEPSGGEQDNYAPGGWNSREAEGVGRYLYHEGATLVNAALSILAPEVEEAFFAATNVGEAKEALDEVAEGLFADALGF